MITSWIVAISSVFTPVSVFLLWKQMKLDHERSRRVKTYDLLEKWASSETHASTAAATILAALTEQEIKKISNQQPFSIEKKHLYLVQKCITDPDMKGFDPILEDKGETLIIKQEATAEIRWHRVEYLDSIESLLMAWRLGIVKEEIMFEQLKPMVTSPHDLLLRFREFAGGRSAWPSIYEFYKTCSNQSGSKKYGILGG